MTSKLSAAEEADMELWFGTCTCLAQTLNPAYHDKDCEYRNTKEDEHEQPS